MPRLSPRIRFGRSPVSLHRRDAVRGARDIDEARRIIEAARAELGPGFPGLLHDLLASRGVPRFDDEADELPLFEDVPFRERSSAGDRGVDELLDPFTLEPVGR